MPETVQILLVEDSLSDARLLIESLHSFDCYAVERSEDGEKALAILRDRGNSVATIVLDLNLPRMNGLEVLLALKDDPMLRDIPVVVVSTSNSPQDIEAAFRLGASQYFVKPFDYDGFTLLAQGIDAFVQSRLAQDLAPAA